MARDSMSRSSKKPTPADQAQAFKAAQEQMKQDAARRRSEAADADSGKKRRSRS
jgi:hypothetical protein